VAVRIGLDVWRHERTGQSTVAELRDLYRVESRSSTTALYGIAGQPLAHSASPAMHNPALAAAGLDAVYVRFETAEAEELFDVAAAFNVAGASVTAPLKPGRVRAREAD
jgi:3-dehydroquinate dehydratase/shikimate dehydrogenase